MDIREAIRTTGAVRTFTDEVVADATVYEILDDARFAPSGGNRQGWRVVLLKDAAARTQLAAMMRPVRCVPGGSHGPGAASTLVQRDRARWPSA